MYSYFLNRMGMRDYRNGWLKGDCPSCGREDKFGVNLHRNRTNCFVCGYDPKPFYLISDNEDLNNKEETLSYLSEVKEMEYVAPIIKEVDETKMVLPKGYTNILLGDSKIAKMARKYVKVDRKLDLEEVSMKGWGYSTEDEYFGYLIIPFYTGNKLTYYNARRFFGSGPKYNNPTSEESGIGKSIVIYNIDALYIYDEVYLMEGAINAETIGDKGIATGGKDISTKQLSIIIKSPIKSIVLLLDPDAIDRTIQLALDLVFHKKVKLVYWEGEEDVNDIGKMETLRRVRKVDYQTYTQFLRMKNDLDYARSVTTYKA